MEGLSLEVVMLINGQITWIHIIITEAKGSRDWCALYYRTTEIIRGERDNY